MENKVELMKKKQKRKTGNVTQFVFEDPYPALFISLMQFSSAFLTEIINILALGGQQDPWGCLSLYMAFKIISQVDNFYLGAIQNNTMSAMQSGSWQPLVIYKSLKWEARDNTNKFFYV